MTVSTDRRDHYSPEQRRDYMNQWRAKRMNAARVLLGGRCSKCGSTEGLEFDHIEPSTKTMEISKMWTSSKQKFAQELAKCQLLCKSCHTAKSSVEAKVEPKHGTLTGYTHHKCRCQECRDTFNRWRRDYRQRTK